MFSLNFSKIFYWQKSSNPVKYPVNCWIISSKSSKVASKLLDPFKYPVQVALLVLELDTGFFSSYGQVLLILV